MFPSGFLSTKPYQSDIQYAFYQDGYITVYSSRLGSTSTATQISDGVSLGTHNFSGLSETFRFRMSMQDVTIDDDRYLISIDLTLNSMIYGYYIHPSARSIVKSTNFMFGMYFKIPISYLNTTIRNKYGI